MQTHVVLIKQLTNICLSRVYVCLLEYLIFADKLSGNVEAVGDEVDYLKVECVCWNNKQIKMLVLNDYILKTPVPPASI